MVLLREEAESGLDADELDGSGGVSKWPSLAFSLNRGWLIEGARGRGLKPCFCGIGVKPVGCLDSYSIDSTIFREGRSLENELVSCRIEHCCGALERTGRHFGGEAESKADRSKLLVSRGRGLKFAF